MSLVKFVKGDTTSNSSTYTRQGTGNIEFDSTTKKIYLDGVDYTGEVEDELLENSNNPVSSSALYKVITENELTTAAALTEHEDAISNINTALNNKQDALTFDSTPTANSLNPVTSGGLYTELSTYAKKTDLTSLLTYKGTIGTSGTVSTLPANASVGDTYQAIAGCPDVNNEEVEEGDLVICIGSNAWTVVQNNIVVDNQLDVTSLNPVQNSAITLVILDNEAATAAALTKLKENSGFTVVGEYEPSSDTYYINNASSLSEAADLLDYAISNINTNLNNKLDTLVSGTDIKTVNNESLLGSGNLDINPIVLVDYWETSTPLNATTGQYWWDKGNAVLKVYSNRTWSRATVDTKKLYIKTPDNTIYRYDGRDMVLLTLNPTTLVTTT